MNEETQVIESYDSAPEDGFIRIEVPFGNANDAKITNTVTGEVLDWVSSFRIEGGVNSPSVTAWLEVPKVQVDVVASVNDHDVITVEDADYQRLLELGHSTAPVLEEAMRKGANESD